jgi:hypothetical protein
VLCHLDLGVLHAQIPLTPGDYRTIASGDFQNPTIWEVWNGLSWVSAVVKPGMGNSIFIDQGHEVRLVQQEEVHHVYLFSAALPGRKLNLQTFELHVYGFLSGMQKVGGLFAVNSVTNATLDWIYPETGKIVFKGSSRTVVDRASWSANTTNSRYTVVFDPDPGQTLVVNSAFKANAFIIQSGTVRQTVNTSGIPACSTFSYNNQTLFNGVGPYGDFIIESGARLISDCSAPLAPMIQRSATVPGMRLEVKEGATLVLMGQEPVLDVAQVIFQGNVIYSATSGTQRMLRNSLVAAASPRRYRNLLFQNSAQKILRDSVFLDGDLVLLSGPVPNHGNGFIRFHGNADQQISGDAWEFFDMELQKSVGRLFPADHLRVHRFLYMSEGDLDFQGGDLWLNASGMGGLRQFSGVWWNLHRIHYLHIPPVLTATNATFPLKDSFQGGIRRFRMTGNSPGGNLQLRYIEIPGANWNPNFTDSDGTPILYQLNSYVEVSGLAMGSSTVEVSMSAENLIVDQVEDLRLVSNGRAAPGIHLLAIDNDTLWARRAVPVAMLNNQSFTIGSYRLLSILPLLWKSQAAHWQGGTVRIRWEVIQESIPAWYIIRKSEGGIQNFQELGRLRVEGGSTQVAFEYKLPRPHRRTFYQLEYIDDDGQSSFSNVFRLEGLDYVDESSELLLFPNPYVGGNLSIEIPSLWVRKDVSLILFDSRGRVWYDGSLTDFRAEMVLERANQGVYFFHLMHREDTRSFKLMKF